MLIQMNKMNKFKHNLVQLLI